jgi:hypothetical protein
MKAGVLLLVATAALPGCAPMAEVDQGAPQAAAPQPLLPEAYAPPSAVAAPTATPPPSPTYAVAPARVRPGRDFPTTMFNPYHPQWTINVQ